MSFKPYPIFNMSTGLVSAREPWLIPKDAFEMLNNCHIRKGVLEKRRGYSQYGRIVHTDCDAETDTNPGNAVMGVYNYYQDDVAKLLAFDTDRVNRYSSGAFVDETRMKIHIVQGGGQNYEPSDSDTLTGVTSGATATVEAMIVDHGSFAAGTGDGTVILENGTISGGPFQDGETLMVGASYAGVADGANEEQEFTGDDSNFFWMENYGNVGYITNNNDQIQKYTGNGQLSRFYIDLDVEGGPDNDVNTCMMIFGYHGRLVLLRTTERGSACNQRARWCNVRAVGTWSDADYIDADTEDWIVGADFIGDDLVVFFERSIWKLSYTSDADLPFQWDKVVSTEGCYSPMSLVAFSDEIIGVGPTHIISTDGRDADAIDDKIPDEMLEWNQDALPYCYGLVLEEESQAWITYASRAEDKPDSILVNNYDDNSWSTYTLPAHVLGYTEHADDVTLDSITDVLDTIYYSFDDKEYQGGYPVTLMGCRTGYVYQLNSGGDDDGSDIEFIAKTARFNPFIEDGSKARLGWVDFLVDVGTGITFDVEFYADTSNIPYQTETVTCTGDDTQMTKVLCRIYCGSVAMFHQLKITNSDSDNRPRIHAIIPYFQKAGGTF